MRSRARPSSASSRCALANHLLGNFATSSIDHVSTTIGTIARPSDVRFCDILPKTRSGKIMRRLLRELAHKGGISGDTTTLEDMSVIERIAKSQGKEEE